MQEAKYIFVILTIILSIAFVTDKRKSAAAKREQIEHPMIKRQCESAMLSLM